MSRVCRISGLIILLFGLSALAAIQAQQVQTGMPPFGTLASGSIDTINLQNLNVHLEIPIIKKPGRGLATDLNLIYDGSVWYAQNAGGYDDWTPALNGRDQHAQYGYGAGPLGAWGWYVQPLGFLTTSASLIYNCYPNSGDVEAVNYGVYDSSGTAHEFPGVSYVVQGYCPQWPPSDTGYPPGTTTDGSGLTLNSTTGAVTDPHGINTTFAGPYTQTDTNGNQMFFTLGSNDNGIFRDTLGQTVLTIAGSGTPSSPITLTYTDPNGQPAVYTIKYAQYTVQTDFGCSGITEYGATPQNLITEIDLPDIGTNPSDKYTFTYESTPGYPNSVTARLASITLPMGGKISYQYVGGDQPPNLAHGIIRRSLRVQADFPARLPKGQA